MFLLFLVAGTVCAHTVPGVDTPADPAAPGCAWRRRDQLSFDFLACEVTYIASHIVNAALFTLAFGRLEWSVAAVLLTEALEGSVRTLFPGQGAEDTIDTETLAGSIVGDGLFNGGLGITLGWALIKMSRAPPLTTRLPKGTVHWGLVALWFFHTLSSLLSQWSDAAYAVAYALFVLAWAWAGPRWRHSTFLYAAWFAVSVSVCVATAVDAHHLIPNKWFQAWIVAVPALIALLLVLAGVSVVRGDARTARMSPALLLFYAALILAAYNTLFHATAALWAAGVAALLAVAAVAWSLRAEPVK